MLSHPCTQSLLAQASSLTIHSPALSTRESSASSAFSPPTSLPMSALNLSSTSLLSSISMASAFFTCIEQRHQLVCLSCPYAEQVWLAHDLLGEVQCCPTVPILYVSHVAAGHQELDHGPGPLRFHCRHVKSCSSRRTSEHAIVMHE